MQHGHTVYECEAELLLKTVEAAVKGGADLRGADLRGADLGGADLGGAYLRGAKINWQSHDMIAELLLRNAGDNIEKRKIAGLVLISRDWCWQRFSELSSDPLWQWAIEALKVHVIDGDNAPELLRNHAKGGLNT
jgi:hypothetical protein